VRNEFSPNFDGVAQKKGLLRPFKVLDVFGRKFKFKAPRVHILHKVGSYLD